MTLDYPDPELTSDLVRLRKWSMGDLECVAKASRAGYSTGSTIPVEYSEEEGKAWIERQWSRQDHGQGVSLAVADPATNEAVGMAFMGLKGIDGHGALGYWVVPEVYRMGLGSGAVRLLTQWALTSTDVYRVVAYVEPENAASIGLLRKCGFVEEGLLRSYLVLDDVPTDVLSFSLLETDLIR